MDGKNPHKLLCLTVFSYRKPDISEDDYHKYISQVHVPLSSDIMAEYGVVQRFEVRKLYNATLQSALTLNCRRITTKYQKRRSVSSLIPSPSSKWRISTSSPLLSSRMWRSSGFWRSNRTGSRRSFPTWRTLQMWREHGTFWLFANISVRYLWANVPRVCVGWFEERIRDGIVLGWAENAKLS